MEIIMLGCGTSCGVPMLRCNCSVCKSTSPKNKRTRSSLMIIHQGFHLLIDTSPELRLQLLNNSINNVDSLLITHDHADHIHGLDDLRPFCFDKPMDVYGKSEHLQEIRNRFSYIFKETQEGGGKPQLSLLPLDEEQIILGGMNIIPLAIKHGELDILGYRINDVAYITDCSFIPENTMNKLKGLKLLIIGALRYKKHSTHFTIDEALDIIKKTGPQRALFTHLNHDVDYHKLYEELPKGIEPGYDGLRINI
ncbi:MAG: MBL fold metallo-hydrolase [Spirochaetaceae bacterium]|jgi:phosphoribosyl 1,2-cyclic phosphate phosphodiesterase|nr:MBL fold metallo-hydrolase [Spirochaetaceae bacterium]